VGGVNVVGIEPSAQGVDIARRLYPANKFYRLGCYDDPGEVSEPNFDAVISVEVIEHLYHPRALLQFARAKLRPGGWLIVTTPYYGYLKNLALCLLNRWDSHHYVLRDGEHIKLFTKATLRQMLREEGFEVTALYGAGRLPFLWRSMIAVAQLKVES
jgi:2-polyprenyl-3-methyl-5-hydroxy-6-metoxy-1,4-benzoquinol methylase